LAIKFHKLNNLLLRIFIYKNEYKLIIIKINVKIRFI
jgi:hypothetical protein